MPVDDEALRAAVGRATTGDQGAVGEVVGLLRPGILRYALSRLPSREVAEDVTQETCLGVVQALARFEDRGHSFTAVAYRIAHHKVVDHWRSPSSQVELVPEVPDRADPDVGPEAHVERLERIGSARLLLAELPDHHRDVLLLRVAAGLSAQEVADVLGVTPGSVRVTQHRALAQLRKLSDRTSVSDAARTA